MVLRIEADQNRFKQIVRGKIRENLRKYVSHGEMIGRRGKDLVSIPLPYLDVPNFRFGHSGSGGAGQGDGDIGQPIARGGDQGDGKGEAGSEPGGHILEVDVPLDELAAILGEELELPNIEPKGRKNISQEKGDAVLFDEVRYFFYITNDRDSPAEEVVFGCNDRCDQENLIAQLGGGVRALASSRCSQLSSTTSKCWLASAASKVVRMGWPGCSRTPTAVATVCGTSSGSVSGASSTSQTPSGYWSTSSAATWRLRRVLPQPPVPVSVSSRV